MASNYDRNNGRQSTERLRGESSRRTTSTARSGSGSGSSRSRSSVSAGNSTRRGIASSRVGSEGRASRATRSSGTSRQSRYAGSTSAAQRYSQGEVMRNRIIAIAILVVLVILLVSLVTCVARNVMGSGNDTERLAASGAAGYTQSASAASTQASTTSASSTSSTSSASSASSAAASSGEGVESPWTDNGRFSSGDAELDKLIKDFCDKNTNKEASREDNAFNVYCQLVWSDYIERDDNQEPKGADWDIVYAKQLLTEGGGNCYEFAAGVEYVLKYFGYADAQGEPCHVLRQSGEYGEHGLVFVTNTDGRKAMCDSSFGADGWMLDADSYTVKLVNVGQDPSERNVADFEEVVDAYWL